MSEIRRNGATGGNGKEKKEKILMLFFCRCSALVRPRGSGSVRLLLLPVDGVEPRDLLAVVEALEVVVAEGLALARVVGVADALLFWVF